MRPVPATLTAAAAVATERSDPTRQLGPPRGLEEKEEGKGEGREGGRRVRSKREREGGNIKRWVKRGEKMEEERGEG